MSALAPLSSIITALFMRRRNRAELEQMKAQIKSTEAAVETTNISNDVNVIDLYKKVYAELSSTLITEHDKMREKYSEMEEAMVKLSKDVVRLERAIKSVSRCKHSKYCPVTKELEKMKNDEK